jgi:hypothetical protein
MYPPALRASDAERDRAAEILRRHYADGRLTSEELEERIERAFAATTLGDLEELFEDLPPLRMHERERRRHRRGSPTVALLFLAVIIAMAAATAAHGPWLLWPLMFFLFFRFMGTTVRRS